MCGWWPCVGRCAVRLPFARRTVRRRRTPTINLPPIRALPNRTNTDPGSGTPDLDTPVQDPPASDDTTAGNPLSEQPGPEAAGDQSASGDAEEDDGTQGCRRPHAEFPDCISTASPRGVPNHCDHRGSAGHGGFRPANPAHALNHDDITGPGPFAGRVFFFAPTAAPGILDFPVRFARILRFWW